jgi:hypothetical protein
VVAPQVAGAPSQPTAVRFRVVAKMPTTTTIRVDSLTATDATGAQVTVNAPGAITVSIAAAQGAR